jgi:tyrosinase
MGKKRKVAAKSSRKTTKFPPHARLFSGHVLAAAPPGRRPALAPQLTVRKSADELTEAEQQVFKDVVVKAIADGIYSQLVAIHADMTHDMHTMPGMPAGTLRFLPWHRVYLVKFEQAMRAFNPAFTLPYWRWMDATDIPAWMVSFTPDGVTDANGNAIPVTRAPGTDPNTPDLPTMQTIQDTVMSNNDYQTFTLALEGAQPYGAHNLVHMWFNGTMSNVPTAPADPMFWMHHAEIDRIWTVWAKANPGQVPNLTGTAAILDPWPEKVSDVLDTTQVPEYPYTYNRTTL